MIWTICCSFAFCAFQIVVADNFDDETGGSRGHFNLELAKVNAEPNSYVLNAAQALNLKGMSQHHIVNKCTMLMDPSGRFENSYENKSKKCQQCFDKAENTPDTQTADNCCKKLVAELKKEAKSYTDKAKTCIADLIQKCNKSETKCRKMAKDIDKDVQAMIDSYNNEKSKKSESDESNKTKTV